jgi:hypothetical protein
LKFSGNQMTDNKLNTDKIIKMAIDNGIKKYITECRENVEPFVDNTFSFSKAWEVNKKALGKDLLKAPANALWTPLYFLGTSLGKGLKKINLNSAGETLSNLPPGFTTDVELEVQWKVYTEFLKLPFKQEDKEFSGNRLLEIILEDEALAPIIQESMQSISNLTLEKNGENLLTENILEYVDSRKAASELSATLIGTATGYITSRSLNFGAVGLGQTLATSAAYHSAVSTFALGNTLGGVFYSVVPISVSTGAVVLSTGGIAALLGVVSAFGGVIADPIQKKLGLHQKKLNKLVDSLEYQLTSDEKMSLDIKDGYAARVLDVMDFLLTVVRK